VRRGEEIVAEHARFFGRGRTIYDPWHYLPILARKPGALRNGAPFQDWALPPALTKLRRKLGSGDEAVWTVARRQLDRLATCAAAAPLVETHHGYAGLDSVDRLCQQLGCAVLLDLGGFFRLTGSFLDPAGVIARRTSAIQVKGFGPDAPATHRALTELPDEAWALLDSAPTGVPITVESKSGTLAEDIGVLRHHCAVAPVGLR